MTGRILKISLVGGSIVSLLASLAIATKSIVLDPERGNWLYRYIRPFNERAVAVAAVACLIT